MRSPFSIVRLLALIVCAAAPWARAADVLTLDDCIRLAQSAQSAATVARQELAIAQAGVRQAKGAFLPQVQVSNGYTYNSAVADTNSFVSLNGIHEYTSLFQTSLTVDTSGRLRAQLARAHADQDAASINIGITQRDLRRAVTSAYYRLLLTQHLVEVARASFDEARSFENRTGLLVKGGEVAQADLIQASAESAFLEQAMNSAELDATLANQDLASFWTVAVNEPLTIADNLVQTVPTPEPAPADSSFLLRPEFKLYDAQKRGFLADYRSARAGLFPQLSLLYEYGIDTTVLNANNRGSAAIVNLTIPVFDWYRALSASRQFQIHAQIVDTNVQASRRNFSRDYQSALARVKMMYRQISLTETQVKFADDNLRLSRIRYLGGEGTALEVVTAQTQLAQGRANYYTAIANYLNARADLEVAEGR